MEGTAAGVIATPAVFYNRSRAHWENRKRGGKGALWHRLIIGVDGEGWGQDEYGRQHYMMLVAAADTSPPWRRVLYTGERLTTHECLRWLYDLPKGFLTGFAFNYDVSMILRDLPLDKLQQLRNPSMRRVVQGTPARFVWWEGWYLSWLPGKCLTFFPKNGQQRTIWDAYSWYQKSFLTAIEDSGMCSDDEIEIVRAGKERRADDEHDWREEADYSSVEMMCLSRLQRHLFKTWEDAGLPLSQFHGPGSGAAQAMRKHGVQQHRGELPEEVDLCARYAYVGGRFEWTKLGRFDTLYEADIVSAYPAAMRELECLAHGDWSHDLGSGQENWATPTQLLRVRWKIDPGVTGAWGPFPQRGISQKMPVWPYEGEAWIWRCEYDGYRWMWSLPGCSHSILESWTWFPSCNHEPFAFVDEYFKQRRIWKKEGDGREKVYKLALNSGYGKVCQRVGSRPFQSWVWAGIITAHCRAKLGQAIGMDPHAVVGVATDAVYSTRRLPVDLGGELGQWEGSVLEDVLAVQPGFYRSIQVDGEWGIEKTRARGIPDRYVPWEKFEEVWDRVPEMIASQETDVRKWGASLSIRRFAGIVKATHREDLSLLGSWKDEEMFIAFLSHKRPLLHWDGTHICSDPPGGSDRTPMIAYDSELWSGERDNEFTLENADGDEWGLTD